MSLIGSFTNGRVSDRRRRQRGMNRSAWGQTGPATIAAAQTARFGALTRAAAGGWKPLDSNGDAVPLTGYVGLQGGALGAYVPSISNGNLIFSSGGAGAPAGAVLRVAYAGGTVDVTIGALVAGLYSVASLPEADTAYENSSLTNRIELRTGHHNPTAARVIIARGQSPAGVWTGTSLLSDGNWVVLTREPGCKVMIGAVEIGGNGLSHPRYLRLDNLKFLSPMTADSNGFGAGSSNGQCNLFGGSHVAVTNCDFGHGQVLVGTSKGAFRAINSSCSDVWIEGNTVDGAMHGIIGDFHRGQVKSNTFLRVLGDSMQIKFCNDLLLQGNVSDKKLYAHTDRQITAIANGASTVLTVATTSGVTAQDGCVITGVSGALGAFLNNRMWKISSITATTITLQADTSAQPVWDGVAGIVETADPNHGDHCQFHSDPGANNMQDRVTIRGNRFSRGNVGGYWPGGQAIFGGAFVARTRTGWLIEGNIYADTMVQAINVSNLVGSTIRSNTMGRIIGMDGANGTALPTITVAGTVAANNTVLDNLACGYALGPSVVSQANNATVALVNDDAIPAHPTSIANYQATFVNPPTVPNIDFDMVADFATRMDAGGAFAGFPIFPGATPYYNHTTHVYSNPR